MKCIIAGLTFLAVAASVKLPPNFKKCNRKDPDLNKCVFEAAQDGLSQLVKPLKSLNTPSLKPLEIPEVTIPGSGSVAVDQNFKNCSFYGFNELKFSQFEFNFDTKKLHLMGIFPQIDMKCDYNFDGKVLLLAIKGEGPSTVVLKNLNVSAVFDYEEFRKNDKTYFKFVTLDFDMDPGLVNFHFANLFNGDKQLGDNINQVLNDNWKEVFGDVKPNYIEVVKKIVLQFFERFFSRLSIEEAFD